MSRRGILCLSAAVSTLTLASGALASSPREDLVRGWLTSLAGSAGVAIEASSYDPALQMVDLRNVRFGGLDKGVFEFAIDELSVTDPREAPGGLFAAHSLKASGYHLKVHIDVAAWMPMQPADSAPATQKTEASPAPAETPAPVVTTGQQPVGVAGKPEAPADAAAPAKTVKPKSKPHRAKRTDAEPAPSDEGDMPSLEIDPAMPEATETPDAPEAAAPPPATPEPPKVIDYAVDGGALSAERLVMPMTLPTFAADTNLFQKFLAVANWSLPIRMDWIETSDITAVIKGDDKEMATVTYQTAYASGFREGRVERAGVDGIAVTYPEPSPIKTFSVGSAYLTGVDRKAILETIDPAYYKDGKGDGVRRTVYGKYGFNNMKLEFEGGVVATVDNSEITGVHMRQTAKPLADILAPVMKDPTSVEKDPIAFVTDLLPSLTELWEFDNGSISGIHVLRGEDSLFSLGTVETGGVSGEGIERLQLRDLSVEAKEAGASGKLDLFNVGDVRFGSLAPFLALASESKDGGQPKPETVRAAILEGGTRIGFIETAGLSVETPMGTVGLGGMAITSSDFLKSLPRRLDVTLTNLSAPVSIIPDPEVSQQLTDMGYTDLSLSAGMTASWDTENGDVRLEDLTFAARDMGSVSMDVHLGNLPLAIIDQLDKLEARMMEGTLVSAGLTYGNEGIVEKGFDAQARKLNQDGATFRKNTAGAVPLMLSFLNDKDIQKQFTGPIKDFLNDPKSLALTLTPKAPVPFSILESFKPESPSEGFKLLGLDLKANE
jgi:hypothetical protein